MVGLVEDTDLEFKSAPYEMTEGGRKELANDLAALANGGGALLVLGVEQDSAGLATKLVPLRESDLDIGLWADQVSASRVHPSLTIGYRAVALSEGLVHLFSIPPSLHAPHCVASAETLRYPVRNGRQRHYLTESGVADRYQRRFIGLSDRSRALDEELAAAEDVVNRAEGKFQIWLKLALVPDVPGEIPLRGELTREWEEWVPKVLKDFPAYNDQMSRYHVALGFRSLIVHDSLDSRIDHWRLGGRLELDGAGVLAFGYLGDPEQHINTGGHRILYDEFLIGDLINGLGLLTQHCLRAGGNGNAQVAATVEVPSGGLVVGQPRWSIQGMLEGTRVAEGVGISRHTISADACAQPGRDRLAAVRLLAGDLLSAFGQPEPLQITDELQLVKQQFLQEWRDRVGAWGVRAGVECLEVGGSGTR
ncbi:MAG TPA: ATP-binding protein [Acidimicrobiales bacterium]|nr:ATP-binding protein [Acidimicrobiales bacterium]